MNDTRPTEHALEDHRTVVASRRMRATPERALDAWLDPSSVRTWMAAPGAGEVTGVTMDPRAGGAFSFVVRRDHDTVVHTGEYLAIDRPRRLRFSWKVPRVSLETSVVTVELTPVGNETEAALTHEGALRQDEARTAQGWSTILESIAVMVTHPEEGARAEEDRSHDVR